MINIGPDPWTTYLAPYVPDIPTPGSWSIHAIKVKSSANGQGPTSPPSQSQFCNHFVITTAIGGVGRILDPSYGKEWVGTAGDPIGLHAFQTGSRVDLLDVYATTTGGRSCHKFAAPSVEIR